MPAKQLLVPADADSRRAVDTLTQAGRLAISDIVFDGDVALIPLEPRSRIA